MNFRFDAAVVLHVVHFQDSSTDNAFVRARFQSDVSFEIGFESLG